MSTPFFLLFCSILLALMVGLRRASRTFPNADLLLEAMRANLEGGSDSGGRDP